MRPRVAAFVAALLLGGTLGIALVSGASPSPFVAIPGSAFPAPAGRLLGHHAGNAVLTVSVALQPSNPGQLDPLLSSLYDPTSPQYQQWLAPGQFDQLFDPTPATIASVTSFLTQAGLTVAPSPSAFIVRATGTTNQVESALHTRIDDFTSPGGKTYFQNDESVQVPASISSSILAVTGLWNTVRLHPAYVTTPAAAKANGQAVPQYGGGPGGSGLTPQQTSSIYGATAVYARGPRGKGQVATLGLFELSGYTRSDITTWEHQFFGPAENVPIIDVNVDGGPVHPNCPSGDSCGPFGPTCVTGCDSADYSGDIEVEADLEAQIAIAPQINAVVVYNAPNDFTGQTAVDEYLRIAHDDIADSISSSWGLCEPDEGLPEAQAESIAFKQMALQGQSVFGAAGDSGAYDCLGSSGNSSLTVDDPASQPWVTGVGGTSFESFDPGSNPHPSYPGRQETVWNVGNLCSGSSAGLANCAYYGAGGGGISNFWAMPTYQRGPGVQNGFTQSGAYCGQPAGVPCREVPDVSANADEFTPYAEYCTGARTTRGDGASTCGSFSSSQPVPGWFGIGGTSLSSPTWSAVVSLAVSLQGRRFGNANAQLYRLYRQSGYSDNYHDITGRNQTVNNNGFYPTTPNYDLATGIGTPQISDLAGVGH